MKNKYFNEREKRLFNSFSNKDDYYKGCYFGETNPIIDNKINKIEKGIINGFKKQLKKTEDKNKKEELLELIKLYEKPATSHEKRVEEVVTQTVVEEKIVKKAEPKVKDPFIFKKSLTERITAVLFIGAMRLSLLTRESLQVLRAGREKSLKEVIINYKLIITI